MQFRSLDGVGVDGQFVRVPTDFGGGPTLVLLASGGPSRPAVAAWLPLARRLAVTNPGVEYVVALVDGRPGPDSEHADSERADSEHADSEHADSERADSERADSEHPGVSSAVFDGNGLALHAELADRATRRRTVFLTDGPESLRTEFGLAAGADVYAFLVDAGEVVWRADGVPTPGLQRSLEAALSATRGIGSVAGDGVGGDATVPFERAGGGGSTP